MSASRHVEAPPGAVFGTITDLAALPEWNERIQRVVERPPRVRAGAEWVVEMRVLGKRFHSRSVILELDTDQRRFVHRSKRDDGNPSHTIWTWDVTPEGAGSRVTLAWDIRGLTLGRRYLAVPMRSQQIYREAPASLKALATLCEARVSEEA